MAEDHADVAAEIAGRIVATPVERGTAVSQGAVLVQVSPAEAEAQAIQVVAQAIGSAGNPAQYLIAQRYLESLSAIATGADKLVFMPYEASGALAALGGIKELLQQTK